MTRSATPAFTRPRLVVLAVAFALALLVPAADAMATGTVIVEPEGSGTGTVTSEGGTSAINCSGPPKAGTCEATFANGLFGATLLNGAGTGGAEFKGWSTTTSGGMSAESECNAVTTEGCLVFNFAGEGTANVTAHFVTPGTEVPFTIKKAGSGEGTVTSAPAGIACLAPCNEQTANLPEGELVTLTASGAPGSKFVEWTGGTGEAESCNGSTNVNCQFPLWSGGYELTAKFDPKPPATTTTNGATELTQTSAKIAGTVNPEGFLVTECAFEYGETASYGSEAACESLPGEGTTPVEVSAELSGLDPATTYHFKLVATSSRGTGEGADRTFTTLPEPPVVTTTAGATGITQTEAEVAGTVDPEGGNVTECKVEYGETVAYGSETACESLPGSGSTPVAVNAALSGLNPNTTYHFRFVATNAGGTGEGADQEFTTLPEPPTVETDPAGEVKAQSAEIAGSVNPNGGSVTECFFEYGETMAYGSEVACESLPGSGETPVPASAELTGLSPFTTYHFRLVAVNAGGTGEGEDQEFTTTHLPPTVLTEAAVGVSKNSAAVAAKVNPNGGEVVDCVFEYGTTIAYGSEVDCEPEPGSGETPVEVTGELTGLTEDTTYHYRVVATNDGGTSQGLDETLKTTNEVVPTVVTIPGASSVAQTTATVGATVNPNGVALESCTVQYGVAGYANEVPCDSLPGAGTTPVPVGAMLTGLSPNTTYHFRVVATNTEPTTGEGADQTFTTKPEAPTVTTAAGATERTQTSAKVAGTVDPEGGNVTICKVEYGESASYGSQANCASLPGSGSSPVNVSASLSGLSANTTYHFRFVATNAGGTGQGADQEFTTKPNQPSVTTNSHGALTQTTAILKGQVDNNGASGGSNCWFQVTTAADTGYSTPIGNFPCDVSPVNGSGSVAVMGEATGLNPNTAYIYRTRATNEGGGPVDGSSAPFTTLPSAPTVNADPGAGPKGQTTATVTGSVNPNSGVSSCKVEYGPTASYGSEVNCASLPGSGSSPVNVSASLGGLSPNTTYHFRFVAMNAGGTGQSGDREFTTAALPPTLSTDPEGAVTQTTVVLNAHADNNGAAAGSNCWFQVTTAADTGYSAPVATPNCDINPVPGTGSTAVTANVGGLNPNTNYIYRVRATNSGGNSTGSNEAFKTLVEAPAVTTTEGTLARAQTTAKVGGTVNPHSGNVTSCKVEYGPTASYGSETACAFPPGSGAEPVAVNAVLGGLTPNTTYHFRLVATNAGGTEAGVDRQFTTLVNAPDVTTTPGATGITPTAATVGGTVDPNEGNVSSCLVEYGPTTAYGASVACIPTPGAGTAPVAVAGVLAGLAPATTYHFRVVATNDGGTAAGPDRTFATAAETCATNPALCPPPVEEKRCKVPRLAGKTVKQARSALRRADCALGKVVKPKRGRGKLVVRRSFPGAGAERKAGYEVKVKLRHKPGKRRQHKRHTRADVTS